MNIVLTGAGAVGETWDAPRNAATRRLDEVDYIARRRMCQRLAAPTFWRHRTRRGVPVLLTRIRGTTYSLTFFQREKCFRVHYPFGAPSVDRQQVCTFRKGHEALAWLQQRLDEVVNG